MSLISVTRLHLRSQLYLLPFFVYTMRSASQAKKSRGFRGGTLGADAQRGYWTVTMWDSEASMMAFRNGGAHRAAMPRLLGWCDEASFAHYLSDQDALPAADEAYRRLQVTGKTSKVRNPSTAHTTGRTVSAGLPRFGLKLNPRV